MPRSSAESPRHLHPKSRRSATTILLASPAIGVGSGLAAPELTLRHPPPPLRDQRWNRVSNDLVVGKPHDCILPAGPPLRLHLVDSGLHWFVCPGDLPDFEYASTREADFWRQRILRGLVFLAHPLLHGFPWSVPESVSSVHLWKALPRQAFKYHKRLLGPALHARLTRFEGQTRSDVWLAAAAHQQPSQLWQHTHSLAEYQVWACYRVATNQLNLYHAGRPADNSCRKLERCKGLKEKVAHIFWDCPTAQAFWWQLIGCWTGEGVGRFGLSNHFRYCVDRQAPPVSQYLHQRLQHRFQDGYLEAEGTFRRIWFILSSACQVYLWTGRNAAVFREELTNPLRSALTFWYRGMRQLRVIALRKHRSAEHAVKGALLYACIEFLSHKPTRHSTAFEIHHDAVPSPALVSWLRTFQTSCSC